jgi:CMP/dCMP kinase
VAIDGPSGAGKGTVCAALSQQLGWHLLDSGAIYRLLGLAALRNDISPENEAGLVTLAKNLDIAFELDAVSATVRALLDGEDVTAQIRTETAGTMASRVAPRPTVRAALLERQRGFRVAPGLVADGRDMGTVVFPDAEVKIFLTASAHERAQRRHKQLIEKGVSANLAALSAEIAERDERDMARATAPLRAAHDAIEVDTTGVPADEVVAIALKAVQVAIAYRV